MPSKVSMVHGDRRRDTHSSWVAGAYDPIRRPGDDDPVASQVPLLVVVDQRNQQRMIAAHLHELTSRLHRCEDPGPHEKSETPRRGVVDRAAGMWAGAVPALHLEPEEGFGEASDAAPLPAWKDEIFPVPDSGRQPEHVRMLLVHVYDAAGQPPK